MKTFIVTCGEPCNPIVCAFWVDAENGMEAVEQTKGRLCNPDRAKPEEVKPDARAD